MKAQAERIKIARRALWQLILDIYEMCLFHKKGSSYCSGSSQGNWQNCCHLVSLLSAPGVNGWSCSAPFALHPIPLPPTKRIHPQTNGNRESENRSHEIDKIHPMKWNPKSLIHFPPNGIVCTFLHLYSYIKRI